MSNTDILDILYLVLDNQRLIMRYINQSHINSYPLFNMPPYRILLIRNCNISILTYEMFYLCVKIDDF